MISGRVHNSEAVIRLQVRGFRNRKQEIDAIIDTGFTSTLTLPKNIIRKLRLNRIGVTDCILADGSECEFTLYEAQIEWDGRILRVEISESDSEPLVGMALLDGFELKVQVRSGGEVTIAKLPSRSKGAIHVASHQNPVHNLSLARLR